MVRLATEDSGSFVVYDARGAALGKVRHPVGRRVLGPGEGTVYLERTGARPVQSARRRRFRAGYVSSQA